MIPFDTLDMEKFCLYDRAQKRHTRYHGHDYSYDDSVHRAEQSVPQIRQPIKLLDTLQRSRRLQRHNINSETKGDYQ